MRSNAYIRRQLTRVRRCFTNTTKVAAARRSDHMPGNNSTILAIVNTKLAVSLVALSNDVSADNNSNCATAMSPNAQRCPAINAIAATASVAAASGPCIVRASGIAQNAAPKDDKATH